MKARWPSSITAFAACCVSLAAYSATTTPATGTSRATPAIIDDSATVVLDGTPRMNWRSVTPKDRDNAIIGRSQVNVKLATAPWLGKTGRIYMVLPADSTGSVRIKWRTHGLMLDGELVAGGRTLVYSGTIRERRMEDVFDVQIEADGNRLSQVQQLRFHFEFDAE